MWFNTFFPFFVASPITNKKLTKWENDIEFQNTFMLLFNQMLHTFKWNGLPDTCNERYLETNLILNGMATIVNDKDYGFLSLRCAPGGNWNMYGETEKIFAYGWNGFMREYKSYMYGTDDYDVEAVVCRDNMVCYPYLSYLIMYANRLTNTMRSLDVATNKLKIPYIIVCEESQKSTIEKMLTDIDNNKQYCIGSNKISPDTLKVLQTGVDPSVLKVFWENYNNLNSEVKTIIGIPNIYNGDKKERLVSSEADGNLANVSINTKMRLEQRKLFAETINKIFGLNVTVEINENYGGEDDASELEELQTNETVLESDII